MMSAPMAGLRFNSEKMEIFGNLKDPQTLTGAYRQI